MAYKLTQFPQASKIDHGVRMLDPTDAPLDENGQPTWWVLRPDLVFAYLEKPPVWNGSKGKGGDWDWSGTGPFPNAGIFDQARTAGHSVSEAVGLATPEQDYSAIIAELANNEAQARQLIAAGALDTALGLPIDYTKRRQAAIWAGLANTDVQMLSHPMLSLNPSLLDAFKPGPKPLFSREVLDKVASAFAAANVPGTPTPSKPGQTTPTPTRLEKIAEVAGVAVLGVGAVVGALWAFGKRR